MPELNITAFRAGLTATLERLAMPAVNQIAYLENLGVTPLVDELALEFDDYWVPLSSYWRVSGESRELHAACAAVDAALERETGWTLDDLGSASWSQIRQLAQRARAVASRPDA